MAGIKGLPSVFNTVITISVISVANSATFGSTRTLQALAANRMAPQFLSYIDSRGRPVWCVIIQLLFGLLAFVNEAKDGSQVFTWLLALSGLSNFFVWGGICLSHIRFRAGWKAQGHSLDELPFRASFGVIGSYVGLILNWLALIATFYTALFVSDFFFLSRLLFHYRLTYATARRCLPRRQSLLRDLSRRTDPHRLLPLLEIRYSPREGALVCPQP